jgi:DNA polymerase-3 subunit epsilon
LKTLCIDFETANKFTGSICSVGISIIENNEIKLSKSWLVKPHLRYSIFSPLNIKIHGLKESDVENADEFDKIFNEKLKPFFKNAVLAAHNASFDMSALRNVLNLYKIPYPEISYFCSVELSRKLWPELPNHKLNTVNKFLKHEFKHHDAFDDAIACANIIIEANKMLNTINPKDLTEKSNVKLKLLSDRTDHIFNINSKPIYNKSKNNSQNNTVEDATIEAQKIFSCVKRMKELFSAKSVAMVLKGLSSEEITKNKFHELSTYGIMKEYELNELEKLMDELAYQGYIIYNKNNKGHIPIVKLNLKAKFVLFKNAKVTIKTYKNLLKK